MEANSVTQEERSGGRVTLRVPSSMKGSSDK